MCWTARASFASFALLVIGGCGEAPASPEPDGGVGPPTRDAGFAIAPPAPPRIPWWDEPTGDVSLEVALPDLSPCPIGWSEVDQGGGVTSCEPYASGGGRSCAPDEAWFASEGACGPIGDACPVGDFPTGLPAGVPVVYVRAGASAGVGTEAQPYGTIGEALAGAAPETIVAIAGGTYDEGTIAVPSGVTLWGACVDRVVLTASTFAGTDPVVALSSPNAALRNVQIAASPRPGIVASGGAPVGLDGVLVRDVHNVGVVVMTRASLEADGLVVRGVTPYLTGTQTSGVFLLGGGTASIRRAVIEGIRHAGVFVAADAGELTLDDAVVRDVDGPLSDGSLGWGIGLLGSRAIVTNTVVEGIKMQGVLATDDATIEMSDSLVRDTDEAAGSASGVTVQYGAHGNFSRVSSVSNVGWCLLVAMGADATLSDVVTKDGRPFAIGTRGAGLAVNAGSVTVDRFAGLDHQSTTIGLLGAATATLRDIRASGNRGELDGISISGAIVVQEGSHADAERLLLTDNRAGGLSVWGAGSSADVHDVIVSGSRRQEVGPPHAARAFQCAEGATLTAERLYLSDNEDMALSSWAGDMTASDVVILDGFAHPGVIPSGMGVFVTEGGTLDLARARVERARYVAVGVSAPGTRLDATDLDVRDTQPVDSGVFGVGLAVQKAAVGVVARASIEGSTAVGILGGIDGAMLSLADVSIADHLGDDVDAELGDGILFLGPGTLDGRVVGVWDVRETGVAVQGMGAQATFDELFVSGTHARRCAETTCMDAPAGSGLGLYDGARARATHIGITENVLCGVQLASGAELDLSHGEVTHNLVGACVQVDGYDVSRLSDDVAYRDNQSNLDSTSLPVPSASLTIEEPEAR